MNAPRPAAWAAALLLLGTAAVRADFEGAVAGLERGDFAAAIPELRRLAGEGDPRARDTLAGLYLGGIGVERDVARAMGWYCRLAHDPKGGPEVMRAVWYLAEYFRTGGGVPGPGYNRGRPEDENPLKAYFWFALMAGQEGLFETVDEPSVILGKIGINAVGRVLYAGEKEALAIAVRTWRPDRPAGSARACLALPEGL
jgi:TPR repeat protein